MDGILDSCLPGPLFSFICPGIAALRTAHQPDSTARRLFNECGRQNWSNRGEAKNSEEQSAYKFKTAWQLYAASTNAPIGAKPDGGGAWREGRERTRSNWSNQQQGGTVHVIIRISKSKRLGNAASPNFKISEGQAGRTCCKASRPLTYPSQWEQSRQGQEQRSGPGLQVQVAGDVVTCGHPIWYEHTWLGTCQVPAGRK